MQIVSLVESTTHQVRSIALASHEQTSSSGAINQTIEEVNRISSETSDAMRQSAQAVCELSNQAQILKNIIEEMQHTGNIEQKLPGKRQISTVSSENWQ